MDFRSLATFVLMALAPHSFAATYNSDGSQSDVQSKINTAVDGDIVTIPSGNFGWSSGVTISGKGITLRGAGAGQIFNRSVSSVAFGTGSKTFTLDTALASPTGGETLRIFYGAGRGADIGTYMEGTVTSYSSGTLTMNITTSTGSGTKGYWVITRNPSTIVTNVNVNPLLNVTEDTSHSSVVEGIRWEFSATGIRPAVKLSYTANGKPIIVRSNWFSMLDENMGILVESIRGLIHDCSFDSGFDSSGGVGNGKPNAQGIKFKFEGAGTWSEADKFGMNDSNGDSVVYAEQCYWVGMFVGIDIDDSARAVIRYSVSDFTTWGTHGYDTSPEGCRHWELYFNRFYAEGIGGDEYNLDRGYFLSRGATGNIYSNTVQDLDLGSWSAFYEWRWQTQRIRRVTANGCCTSYPCLRQTGHNHNGTSYFVDPVHLWGNSYGDTVFNLAQYNPDDCGNGQLEADYVVNGRDVTNKVRSGYTMYTYPHPLNIDGGGESPPAPAPATRKRIKSIKLRALAIPAIICMLPMVCRRIRSAPKLWTR